MSVSFDPMADRQNKLYLGRIVSGNCSAFPSRILRPLCAASFAFEGFDLLTDCTFLAGSEIADKVGVLIKQSAVVERQGFEWQIAMLIGQRH